MNIVKIIFNIMKKLCGITLCIGAIGLLLATEGVEPSEQPIFILLFALCVFGAVMLLKKTNKDKGIPMPAEFSQDEFALTQVAYTPSKVPADTAKEMRKYYTLMQARDDARIMSESFKLASTTTNLDTFCMRYELALRKAYTLLQAEEVGVRGIKKLNCHNACVAVIEASSALKVRVLDDYGREEMYKAEGLKTDKGKCNRYSKMLTTLEKAEDTFMFMDEYDALIARVKKRITELGGATV